MTRILLIALNVIAGLVLLAVVSIVVLEFTWTSKEPSTPEEYFLHGSTGTEFLPLPVLKVLPDMFPENFQPGGPAAGDWVRQFGFVRGQSGVNEGLPVGMNISYYRPKSGAPSPLAFVGFNCAMCHVGKIQRSATDEGVVVYGMANPALDLVAFGEAAKASILDEKRFTLEKVTDALVKRGEKPPGMLERLMLTLWLKGTRDAINADFPMRNYPYAGTELRDARLMPSGPGRNEPMKETVRFLMRQTPEPGGGASKIPCVYHQERRPWGQYDGALGDRFTRNSMAALGVGASIENLRIPGILHTIQKTADYLQNLPAPAYATVFPEVKLDAAQVLRGKAVYQQHCANCHGAPGDSPGTWVKGPRQGEIVPIGELGTDPGRVSFRFYASIAQTIYDFFPAGHPLKPKREELRPNPGDPPGLISSPLEGLFSRAPYLHNGSVPTLAQLINLQPRAEVFFRGSNTYDAANVGLLAPAKADASTYFEYQTRIPGNLNRGHDYPWAFHGPGWDEAALKDLLEYLKTL